MTNEQIEWEVSGGLETLQVLTASDLVDWLTNDPIDLSQVYVTDRNGDRILATMIRETLTDGSVVYNLELGSASA